MMTRSDDEDGVLCKTPSPRSSASQAPPNPRHNPDEPPPRVNLYAAMPAQPSHPFRGLSRKFLSKKENDHKRGRSVDIGRPVGVYDTPNVRERVKRWQQSGGGVALHGDVVELPPISPATPTPGSRRGMPPAPLMPGFEMSLSGLASTMGSDAHAPLEPPRMPAIQQDWSSASEGEREAERNRTRSKERERKLRRKQRQNSEDINDRPGTAGSGYDTATPRPQANSPVVYEDDGIRISAMRKSSGSKRKRREKSTQEIDETDDGGGVGLLTDGERSREIVSQTKAPTPNILAAPAESSQPKQTLSEKKSSYTLDFDDGIRIAPMKSKRKSKPRSESASFEIEVEFPDTEPESPRKTSESKPAKSSDYVKVNAWDNEDGIRIYANKSPVKFTDRKRSVRQSAKSVRSRREQFEADLKKEKHQQKSIEESVREHEGDDEDDGPISAPKSYRRAEDTPYDHYHNGGTSSRLQKSKSTRRKKSDDRLRIDTQNMDSSVRSDGIIELPKPAKFTESAPATPTGGRMRDLESYNESYNSPFSAKALDDFQNGLEEMVSRSPSLRKLRDLSPPRHITESVISSSQVSSQRARTKYSPTRDRGERRAERRELRRKLREDSEKFQTFDIRSRSESPAPQRREAEKYPVPKQLAEYYVETIPIERPPVERAPVERAPVERVMVERAPVQQTPIVKQPPVQKSMPIVKPTPEKTTPIPKPQEEKIVPTAKPLAEKIPVVKTPIEKTPEAKPKVEEKPLTSEKSLVKERTVSKEKLPPKQAPKARPVSEYSVMRDIMVPPPQQKSATKEPISVQARARLFEQVQEPTPAPSHKKSSSLSISSSVDDIDLKREKLHASSFSSDKPAYPKSALKSKEAPGVTRRRSKSTPPDSRILRRGSFSKILDSFDAPVQKKEPNLVPKLTSATSTFFKAIKEGFKGESVRSIGIVSTIPHSAKDDHHSMTESMIDSELQSRDTEEELSSVEEAPKKKKTVGFIEVEHSSTEEDDEEEDEESDSEASSDSESNAGVSDKDTERESEFLSEDGSLHSDDEGDISKDSIEPPVDLPIVEPLRITPRGSPVPGFKAMNTEAAKPLTEIPIIPPSKPLAISSSDKVTKDTPKPSSETPVTKAVEEPSKQTSNAISTPEPTASRKISPIELPKPSPKDSSVEPSTPFPRPLSIPPLKTKIVEPLKTPTKKAAMGTVEEPPKRSVKDLVRQLESKPDKTAKVPPPEPLLDLLKEPVRVPDESPKSRDLEKSSSESSRDKPIQQSQKAEDVQKEPTKGVLEKSVQPSNTQDSVDTSLSDDIDETTESAEESVLSAESIPTTIEKSTHHISPDTSPNKELIGESPTARKENRIEDTNSEEILQDTAPKLSEIPALPFPKRSLRGTTAPPRPKSIRSDGTLSPPGSVCGESIDGEPFSRSISDASMVKPLQFKKAVKPATEDTVPPLSPTKEAGAQDWFNPNVPVKESSLKRRYTKHADLMSILSVPKSERTASRSRRSKGLKRVETLSVDDLLRGFAYEEVKYLRELRTLVEDVVPILFQTVLGRADDDLRRSSSISSVGTSHTGSTRSSRAFSSNPTRPIVDMGISLERLRTLHERIPTGTVEQVLAWAVDARRVYEEYLSVWRLGFQDVVVLMTPDEEDYAQARRDSLIRKELEILHAGGTGSLQFEGDPSTWAMPPPPAMDDELKDEKVDVAFLLKRPLVRLKLLAKLFKRIDYIQASPAAASLSTSFHSLVTMARRKISEEKARIEDEAAASLDVSRVYDFYTLLPRQNVSLDQNRRVKARDCFTMRLYHSSDDVIERSVELILRDPSPRHKYGDAEVLFAEVGENATKWLLFPPVPLANVSARTGDTAGEIVVMVRGLDQESREWREVMALASSTAAGFEWVQMLGLTPIPPEGPFSKEPREPAILETVIEESVVSSRVYVPAPPRKQRTTKETTKKTDISVFEYLEASDEEDIEEDTSFVLPPGWLPPNFSAAPVKPSEEFGFMGGHFEVAHISFRAEPPIERSGTRSPSLHSINDIEDAESRSSSIRRSRKASKPHRRIKSQSSHHSAEGLDDPEHPLHRTASVHLDDKERPSKEGQSLKVKNAMDNIPDLSPSSLPGPARDDSDSDSDSGSDSPPPVPPHRSATKSKHGHSKAAPVTTTGKGAKRRTSSPLKHEYDPSSPSNSESEHYERHGAHGEDDRSSSGSSSEEDSDDAVSLCSEEEDGDYPPPLLSIPRRISRQPSSSIVSIPRTRPLESNDVDSQGTLTPGMRTPIVPPHPELPPPPIPIPQIGHKFRASIFVWAVKQWETVPPGDCMIVITPGRLEAYPWTPSAPATPTAATTPNDKSLASAGSYDSLKSQEELLFAFDLAATLKIRQGTAVDINIKTPPTSRFGGENIMMRCRSQNECEILWNTVNCNRIYPQVQLPPSTIITSSSVTLPSEMSNASSTNISIKRGFGAWARSKTYRAGANGTMSTPSLVSTPSEASATSTGSAFSRFKTNIFGKNKGSMASSSSMDGSSRSGSPTGLPNVPGIENSLVVMTPMKIRFYRRENPSKWQDIGNARLIVLKPLDGQRARNQGEDEKRVVIVNKKGTTVHLDVILGESAFERVARTGIAISILTGEGEEDGTGKPGDTGGLGAKNTVYMMNMKSDAEAAFTFSILGKLRY